jgi:hypothetical protein
VRLVTKRSTGRPSPELCDLLRRCAGTIAHLQSQGVSGAELYASALHHSRPVEKIVGLRDLCGQEPDAVVLLLGVRLELVDSMPTETKSQRDAVMACAVQLLSEES